MISAHDFWSLLKQERYTFFSGVPCSLLKEALDYAFQDREITYIPAVREDAALGVASGAYLCGRKSGILIQNSGLGNLVNGLTSFNLLYKVPVLMFITWRGYRGKDAPEHLLMGKKTLDFLWEMEIPAQVLDDSIPQQIRWAVETMEREHVPVALIVRKGTIQ